jgi:hypothetical protein
MKTGHNIQPGSISKPFTSCHGSFLRHKAKCRCFERLWVTCHLIAVKVQDCRTNNTAGDWWLIKCLCVSRHRKAAKDYICNRPQAGRIPKYLQNCFRENINVLLLIQVSLNNRLCNIYTENLCYRSYLISTMAITNAPWYVTNQTLHDDLKVPFITDVIQEKSINHHDKL